MLERHGPYPTEQEARAVMDADPRPQAWLAAQGAMLWNHLPSPDWFAFIPAPSERENA